jgi:5-methylcytosine-specific restriction endonuclease McrA
MPLIKFESAHKFLDEIGVPRLDSYKNNVIIDRVDLTIHEREGNIEWEEDGIYLNYKDQKHRGFMYIKHPDIQRFGYPKFHLLECKTIEQQKRNGRFDNHYFWSNSPTVTLTDRVTHKNIKDVTLTLCNNCKNLLLENTGEEVYDTEDFHDLLDLNDIQIESNNKEQDTDINGYPLNWRTISRAYREEQNYVCEDCGFGGEQLDNNFDRRYIHVHHINSNQKTNTHRNNLKTVCVLCHYSQDEHHMNNFEKPRLKKQLESFIKKYKTKLIEVKNPYIHKYFT